LLLLILFNTICLNFKISIQIYRPSFNSSKLVIGFLIYQNEKLELWLHWLEKFSLIKTNWLGSDLRITNIPEQRYGYQNSTENKLFANLMITFLLVTMRLKNHI
jgi:hypothetical protein